MGGDVPVHVGDDALRQVVGLDLPLQRQRAQTRGAVPMAADHPPDHARMAVVVAAGAVAVSVPGAEKQRQVPGVPRLQKPPLQRGGQCFRAGTAHKPSRGQGIAVPHQQGGLLRGENRCFSHVCPAVLTCSGKRQDASPGTRSCLPSGRRWRSTWRTSRSPGRCRPWHTSRRWERSW